MNELKTLLNDHLKSHQLTRNTFIQKLGYKNITKGLRQLDTFINKHPKNAIFKTQFCKQLDISVESIDEIINEQQALIHQDKINKFTPYIRIKWKNDNPLLFMLDEQGLPDIYQIAIPLSFLNLSFKQQVNEAFELYKQHQLDFYADKFDFKNYTELLSITDSILKQGSDKAWPVNEGYIYHKGFDESFQFNRLGEQVES